MKDSGEATRMRSTLTEGACRCALGWGATLWLFAAVTALSPAPAMAGTELAVTIDDLPATGPLPAARPSHALADSPNRPSLRSRRALSMRIYRRPVRCRSV